MQEVLTARSYTEHVTFDAASGLQSGQPLPDGVLVATLLNKTTGALQQHLRLNARTLQTYAQVREVILEYHRSRRLMNPVAQTSANATFQGGASAPMHIGALAAAKRIRKRKGLFEVIRKRESALELYERKRKRERKR